MRVKVVFFKKIFSATSLLIKRLITNGSLIKRKEIYLIHKKLKKLMKSCKQFCLLKITDSTTRQTTLITMLMLLKLCICGMRELTSYFNIARF